MHNYFILRYIKLIKKEININTTSKNEDVIYFINTTIKNLPDVVKFSIHLIGLINFFFLKLNFVRFDRFINFFNKLIIFNKYILFIKTLIIMTLTDNYRYKNHNDENYKN